MEADVGPRITGLEHKTEALRKAIVERNERISNEGAGSQNVNVFKLEGGKSVVMLLLVGLVCGVCLGGAVALVGWVSWALTDTRETLRDHDAFIRVTYQNLPELRAEYEKIKAEQAAKGKSE